MFFLNALLCLSLLWVGDVYSLSTGISVRASPSVMSRVMGPFQLLWHDRWPHLATKFGKDVETNKHPPKKDGPLPDTNLWWTHPYKYLFTPVKPIYVFSAIYRGPKRLSLHLETDRLETAQLARPRKLVIPAATSFNTGVLCGYRRCKKTQSVSHRWDLVKERKWENFP